MCSRRSLPIFCGILIGHEAKAQLRDCLCGDNALDSLPGMAAGDTIERQGRPDRGALIRGVPMFTPALHHMTFLPDSFICGTHPVHVLALGVAPVAHIVIKPGIAMRPCSSWSRAMISHRA
jgi:hypothetical protein